MKKSFFLFGPRATGKSSLIRHQLAGKALIINLLRTDVYLRLLEFPSSLESMIDASKERFSIVVIDEVQRIPMLLNEVHRLIEERGFKFLLTGSSARSLRHGHVNLLAGRAWEAQLFPFTSQEIPDFDLARYLRYGGLPPVYLSNEPEEELFAYVNTYLKEEIQAESLIRKIPAFTRFLRTSALTNGQILNFTAIASDSSVPASTIREYYHILEDTFIGFLLPAWTRSKKRKALSTAKFYFFDLGVAHTLAGITALPEQSDLYGRAFEHFIALELRSYISYSRSNAELQYWRSVNGDEVDFVYNNNIAIEVKTTTRAQDKHAKGLLALAEENLCERYILVSHDKINRKDRQIEYLYWEDFLTMLWDGKLK